MGSRRGAEQHAEAMPERSLQDLKHADQAVRQETQASMQESWQRMQDQIERAESCKQVISMLKGLPDRPSHDIMLPLGKAAFLPARLTDIERCQMTLGEHGEALLHTASLTVYHSSLSSATGDVLQRGMACAAASCTCAADKCACNRASLWLRLQDYFRYLTCPVVAVVPSCIRSPPGTADWPCHPAHRAWRPDGVQQGKDSRDPGTAAATPGRPKAHNRGESEGRFTPSCDLPHWTPSSAEGMGWSRSCLQHTLCVSVHQH